MEQIPSKIHESWYPHVQKLFDDPKMAMLKYGVLTQVRFYPKPEDIFNVFRMPLDKIKVVILGQDPYINKDEAMGYAFAVPANVKAPPTLKVIKEEIVNSGVERDTRTNIDTPEWKELKHWRQQGIFLLNSALTVQVGESGSHVGYWQWFIREIIRTISLHNTTRPIWVLWGSRAKQYKGYIHSYYGWNGHFQGSNYSYILEGNHPAAEVYNSSYKFSGCNHFNLVNEILKHKKQTIINW